MPLHHFISYSPNDAADFAAALSTKLEQSGLQTWLDRRDLHSDDWAEETNEALKTCSSLVFVLSVDSAKNASRCTREWRRAINYSKPISVVRLSKAADCPFRLETRKIIDFSTDVHGETKTLVERLSSLANNPAGELDVIQELIDDAKRELDYTGEGQKSRIVADLLVLEQRREIVRNAIEHTELVPKRIALGIERERQPRETGTSEVRVRFVNPPPMVTPRYFQDRFVETKMLGQFLQDDASRLLTISGRGGIGKTAFACRTLKYLETGALPDGAGDLRVSGIVYMNAAGTREITFPNLISDLLLILEPEVRNRVRNLVDNPEAPVAMKVGSLLEHFQAEPVVVLLDNFEDLLSPNSRLIQDPELANCLSILVESNHSIKIIVTTRVIPLNFAEFHPSRHTNIAIDGGLTSPFAEQILKELDGDGHVGLRDASDETLAKVREHTRGFPRALEAFYAILAADRDTTIREILSWNPTDRVVYSLVGEAYSRLPEIDQRVMQALAIYNYPSKVVAVDYLLEPWFPIIDSADSLKRLVNMQMVRKENNSTYYLHPIDREYALSRLEGTPASAGLTGHNPLNRDSLLKRAADFYEEIEKPQSQWQLLEDVEPHTREYWLRLDARQDAEAAEVLSDIRDFLVRRGAFEQILAMSLRLLGCATSDNSRKEALKGVATSKWRLGKNNEAISAQEQLLQLVESEGDVPHILREKFNLIHLRSDVGVTEDILQGLKDLLGEIETLTPWDQRDIGVGLSTIATCQLELGYLDDALVNAQRARELARVQNVDFYEGNTHNLGSVYLSMGLIAEARKLFEEALSLNEKSGNPLWKANHLGALGSCYDEDGNLLHAIDCKSAAIQIREQIGDLIGIAFNTCALASYYLEKDDLLTARRTAERALKMAQDLRHPLFIFQETLARVLLHCDDLKESQRLIESSLEWQFGSRFYRQNLHGIILLRRRMRIDATKAFNSGFTEAQTWLKRCDLNSSAWASKGLALAGLVACGDSSVLRASREAYERARQLNGALGAIAERQRLFHQLRKACTGCPELAQIESAISGEETQVRLFELEAIDRIQEEVKHVSAEFRVGHALVIAIANYPQINPGQPLPPTVLKDATDIAQTLQSAECGYSASQLSLLLDDKATGREIRKALQKLIDVVSKDDTVIVFFSGHGARRDSNGGTEAFLLPFDCDPDHLEESAIHSDELTAFLSSIEAQRVLVLLDACHSGGVGDLKAFGPRSVKSGLDTKTYDALAKGVGRVIMASSRPDEFSLILAGMQNSLFTHFLLEGLKGAAPTLGDGFVRVFDLVRYISDEVPKRAASQHPIFKIHSETDFAVALYRGGTKQPMPGSPTVRHAGLAPKAKLAIIDRLGESWRRLAIYFDIPAADKEKFPKGDEPEKVLEWIEARKRTSEIKDALNYIGRDDLVLELN